MIIKRNSLGLKRPFIEIQFLVFNHNKGDSIDIKKLTNKLNADGLVLRAAQAPNDENIRKKGLQNLMMGKDFVEGFGIQL